MSENHSDCRYANRGDLVPVTGTLYTTYFFNSFQMFNMQQTLCVVSRVTFPFICSHRIEFHFLCCRW